MSMWHLIQFNYDPDGATRAQVRRPGGGHLTLVYYSIFPAFSAQRSSLTRTRLLALKRCLSRRVAAKSLDRDPRLRCSCPIANT